VGQVRRDFRLNLCLSCYAFVPTLMTNVKNSHPTCTPLVTTGFSLTVPFGLVVNTSSSSYLRNPRFNLGQKIN
jgi:hypothetical protein